MNKQQIIDAIVADLRGRLNTLIPPDTELTQQGGIDLYDDIGRPCMNHANAECAQHWADCVRAHTFNLA